jgi:hypothetical protein
MIRTFFVKGILADLADIGMGNGKSFFYGFFLRNTASLQYFFLWLRREFYIDF